MKYLILFVLMIDLASASGDEYPEEMEVGSPQDCLIVGKTNDSKMGNELNEVQRRVMDCLSPDEKDSEAKSGSKNPEVVSQ